MVKPKPISETEVRTQAMSVRSAAWRVRSQAKCLGVSAFTSKAVRRLILRPGITVHLARRLEELGSPFRDRAAIRPSAYMTARPAA
jgi:hypothetical protein